MYNEETLRPALGRYEESGTAVVVCLAGAPRREAPFQVFLEEEWGFSTYQVAS